ncbi:hypothetical protein [Clostridium transplantifaecale]|uniref:hypothetical protein n=1 Tax=Clostridium transplantifaecale TaxID=2479838 RepID=UPI000F64037A|nr:hypothetical protein [Clostridium transplantifaecale]
MKIDEIYYRVLVRLKGFRLRQWEKPHYFKTYPASYHKGKNDKREKSELYMTERVSYGAGIGHQLANWIAGYWFARYFDVKYAYSPFTSSAVPFRPNRWDYALGFGEGEITAEQLLKAGYKKVLLPYFDEKDGSRVSEIKRIIDSYAGEKVVFYLEADQFYFDQFGVMDDLKYKFFSAPARKEDKLIYDNKAFNIAIHIRRGDIVQTGDKRNENLAMRYQGSEYFVNALDTALEYLKDKKNIHIYLFSQGKIEDYAEFSRFENLHVCLNMGAIDSFIHMAYADALITSKSSFSYKPALLNRGIKFCPADFWHGYPDCKDWILLNEQGRLIQ